MPLGLSPPLTRSKGQFGVRRYPQADVCSVDKPPLEPLARAPRLISQLSLWILSFLNFPHRRSEKGVKRPTDQQGKLWVLDMTVVFRNAVAFGLALH